MNNFDEIKISGSVTVNGYENSWEMDNARYHENVDAANTAINAAISSLISIGKLGVKGTCFKFPSTNELATVEQIQEKFESIINSPDYDGSQWYMDPNTFELRPISEMSPSYREFLNTVKSAN